MEMSGAYTGTTVVRPQPLPDREGSQGGTPRSADGGDDADPETASALQALAQRYPGLTEQLLGGLFLMAIVC